MKRKRKINRKTRRKFFRGMKYLSGILGLLGFLVGIFHGSLSDVVAPTKESLMILLFVISISLMVIGALGIEKFVQLERIEIRQERKERNKKCA